MVPRPQLNILRRVPCDEPSKDPENHDLTHEWVEVEELPKEVMKGERYFEFARKVYQFIKNLKNHGMSPPDINIRTTRYLILAGQEDLELEEVLRDLIINV